jgi:regulator of protease activity HflC (stomatin/prohibitin superfamily)
MERDRAKAAKKAARLKAKAERRNQETGQEAGTDEVDGPATDTRDQSDTDTDRT